MLLGELCLNGYVDHVGAEGSGPRARRPTPARRRTEVTGGGPVLRVDADGQVTSRAHAGQRRSR